MKPALRVTPIFGVPSGVTVPYLGTNELPDAILGVPYLFGADMTAPIIAQPVTYSITSGSLPPGLSLSSPDGLHRWEISGTPTTLGSYTFNLLATNSVGTANESITLDVVPALGGGNFTFLA